MSPSAQSHLIVRVVKTVFLENVVVVPWRKQLVLMKMAKIKILHSTHKKNRGFLLLRTQKLTKMTKMADVTQAKSPFAKSTVLTTPRLCYYYSTFCC